MLRISVHDDEGAVTFRLEGRLAGSWVQELEQCWRSSSSAGPARTAVRFDLTEVTSIDDSGKAFLAARHAEGAELIASGCLMKAVVWEIAHIPAPGREVAEHAAKGTCPDVSNRPNEGDSNE